MPTRRSRPPRSPSTSYETKERLPRTIKELREHAAVLKLAFPNRRGSSERLNLQIKAVVEEMTADRADRGLQTAADGPSGGARLMPEEIDALIANALPSRPWREWSSLDEVLDAFSEFVEEFDGSQKITTRLYNGHRKERGWPSNDTWQKHGLRFQELVEQARERVRERRKKAA